MQFSELQTMTTECLPPALKAQTSIYSLARVKASLNRGYRNFVARTKSMQDEVDITVVAQQFEYTKADSANLEYVFHPYHVRYIDSGSTDIGWKVKPYPGGFAALPRVKSYARPDYYWWRGVNTKDGITLGTWSIANSTGATMRLYSYMFPASDLSADGDIPDIKEAYHDALPFYAVSKLFNMFAHVNPQWKDLGREYWGYYLDQVNDYNEVLAIDSEDELPTLFNDSEEYF